LKITYRDSAISPQDLRIDTLFDKIEELVPDLNGVLKQDGESLSGGKRGVHLGATLNHKGLAIVVRLPRFVGKGSVAQAKELITRVVNAAKEECMAEFAEEDK